MINPLKLRAIRQLVRCRMHRHVWNRDPNQVPEDMMFYRVDCVQCGYSMDAVLAKALFDEIGERIPGRVAE